MLYRIRDEAINQIVSECSKLASKKIKDKAWLVREGNLVGIVQTIEFCPYYQIVNTQTRIHPRKGDVLNSLAYNRIT